MRDAEERDGIDLSPLTTERFVAVVPAARGDRVEATAPAADPLSEAQDPSTPSGCHLKATRRSRPPLTMRP
ncbi:hypothetical protein GCM10010275_67480 [Streptomyces litmocidini]|nr:hypothetical protein GCM10010275_67480 [Streptomyces litmocidini]